MYKYIIPNIVVFAFICMVSCEKEINLEFGNFKPKLVVNCILDTSRLVIVEVESTSTMADTLDKSINDAVVKIWENDKLIGILTNIGDGLYQSDFLKPKESFIYKVEANALGYERVTATDTIPTSVNLTDSYYLFPSGFDVAEDPYAEFVINFKDPANQTNYYEALFYSQYSRHDGGTANVLFGNFSTDNHILVSEGDMDYHPSTIFFTDKLFNGKAVTINVKSIGYSYGFNPSKEEYSLSGKYQMVEFRNISWTYYQYLKKLYRHLTTQGINLDIHDENDMIDFLYMGEPVNMYTNVINGYGIFAGFSKSNNVMRNESKR